MIFYVSPYPKTFFKITLGATLVVILLFFLINVLGEASLLLLFTSILLKIGLVLCLITTVISFVFGCLSLLPPRTGASASTSSFSRRTDLQEAEDALAFAQKQQSIILARKLETARQRWEKELEKQELIF